MPLIGSENENTSSLTLDHLNSHPDVDCEENNEVAVLGSEIPRPPTVSPFALTNFHVSGDGNSEMAVPSSSGLYTSESDNMGRGDALHVDVVSIASNTLSSTTGEINSRETRRSNRRLFWDAVSRHGSRRSSDFPTIVFATGYAEDLGSHDRWLLDLSGDFHDDGVGYQSRYLSSRSRLRSAQRWLLRSEVVAYPYLQYIVNFILETIQCWQCFQWKLIYWLKLLASLILFLKNMSTAHECFLLIFVFLEIKSLS